MRDPACGAIRLPLGDPRQALDPQIVRRACDELGLDASQLPDQRGRAFIWPTAPAVCL